MHLSDEGVPVDSSLSNAIQLTVSLDKWLTKFCFFSRFDSLLLVFRHVAGIMDSSECIDVCLLLIIPVYSTLLMTTVCVSVNPGTRQYVGCELSYV